MRSTEGVLPRALRANTLHLCLNSLGGETLLGHLHDQAQGGLASGGVETQRAVWEPQGHGTMPEVFKQGPTMEIKSS